MPRESVFERYTEEAKCAIWFAFWEGVAHQSRKVTPEHLLLGTLTPKTIGNDPFQISPVYQQLRDATSEGWPPHRKSEVDELRVQLKKKRLRFDDAGKRVLAWAVSIAEQRKPDRSIGVDDLTLAIWREGSGKAASLLEKHFLSKPELASQLDLVRRVEAPAFAEDRRTVLLLSIIVLIFMAGLVALAVFFRPK